MIRKHNELRMGQRALVIWLFGLSGAGKSTLAIELERHLVGEGVCTTVLDGDNLRTGLNQGLGFSDVDRAENLRRAAEVAKLMLNCGLVVICAFITPLRVHRRFIRTLLGERDLLLVYLSASFAACEKRDPKGLYIRSAQGKISQFTGRDSPFETPAQGEIDLVVDTGVVPIAAACSQIVKNIMPRIR